jgi:sRNA-binding carbon storage regulator CsrA
VIKLLAIQGNRVKLGFIGDRSTKVMRTEIIDLPKKEAMNNDE